MNGNCITNNKEEPEMESFNDHPDQEQLIAFLESPASGAMFDIRQHLAVCDSCRELVAGYQAVSDGLKKCDLEFDKVTSEQCPDENMIADYADGLMAAEKAETIKSHLVECGPCLKSATHYARYSSELKEEILQIKPATDRPAARKTVINTEGNKKSGIFSIVKNLFSSPVPGWYGVSSTAAVVVLLIFSIFNLHPDKSRVVLSYQEEPYLLVSAPGQPLPGLGFFHGAKEERRSFAGVSVQQEANGRYSLSWQAVNGAEQYMIRVYREFNGDSVILAEENTQKSNVVLDLSLMEPGKNYIWELTGMMKDGRKFISKGGLVVGNVH